MIQENRAIVRVDHGCAKKLDDVVVNEYKLELWLNDQLFARLLCSPQDVEYLVIGYLYGEKQINAVDDILAFTWDEQSGSAHLTVRNEPSLVDQPAYLTTGLGPQKSIATSALQLQHLPITNGMTLQAEQICMLAESFQQHSAVFAATGGVHSCALSDGKQIVAFFEDIGRHNALDKIVGYAVKHRLDLGDHLLITSGRIPGYMAYKCYNAGLPIIISRAAVTTTAIDFACQSGLTLIGFARGSHFNIYSGEKRVLTKNDD